MHSNSTKKPLFTPTKNLDVEYLFLNGENYEDISSVSLEGNNLHKELTMGCTQALHLRTSLQNKNNNPVYKSTLKDVNFATMGITLLYSDTDLLEGYLGDDVLSHYLPIESPFENQRIVSTMDFYSDTYQQPAITQNKAARCHLYNQSLKNRVRAFQNMATQYHLGTAKSSVGEVQQMIESSQFHETYHHTEQTGLFYLETDAYIHLLLKELKKIDAALFYGFVLDIHTQRMMCLNCNLSVLGIQKTASAGFLNKFSKALKKTHIEKNEIGISFSARVSAEAPCSGATLEVFKLQNDESTPHLIYPQMETEVLQKYIPKRLPGAQYAGQSIYQGAFFASSKSTKLKWEEAIASCPHLKI